MADRSWLVLIGVVALFFMLGFIAYTDLTTRYELKIECAKHGIAPKDCQ